MRVTLLISLAGLGVCLAACATSADRQVLSAAYESCKGKQPGEARDRCIKGERSRLAVEQAASNERCLREIAAQDDRAAMRRGERTGDPSTRAAGGGCSGGAIGGNSWSIGP
ncbi:MAG: hypothetical protein AAGH41_11575 [Pseudomonadota bacterium]